MINKDTYFLKLLINIAPNYLSSKIKMTKTDILIIPEEQLKIISISPIQY